MANRSHLPSQWRASGLTQQSFCDREGVSLATFSYWRGKELRGELPVATPAAAPTSTAQFTEVVVEPSAQSDRALEITLPDGTVIRIPIVSPC